MANWLQLIGTALGFFGTLIMAKEILLIDKTTGSIKWLAESKENAKRNRYWTLWGLGLVALGFVFQSWSTILNM